MDGGVVTDGDHFPDDDGVEVAHAVEDCTVLHIAACDPMRMELTSPRTTAFIQMLAWSPRTTSPMTCAEGST